MLKTLNDSFRDFRLRDNTHRVLVELGFTTPTPIQSQAIPALLEGRDVVGQARTGSGKTLAFTIPLIERCDSNVPGVQALILLPTRELAVQVCGVLDNFAKAYALRAITLYGGRSPLPEKQALRRAQIVVGTPGRTLDHLRQGNLKLTGLRILVLDEGDEMLDQGFAPDVERIIAATPASRQTALFSATVPAWITNMVKKHLRNPVVVKADPTQQPPVEIEHTVYQMDASERLDALRALLDGRGDGPVLVFGRTKHGVKKLAAKLEEMGYPVAALQGNLSQNARERVMADFRSGEVKIMLATNVAARGLDVEGIEQVINYELPESPELFTHRVGRTGRMGRSGEAITFVTPDEMSKWRQIERTLGHSLPLKIWRRPAGQKPMPQPKPEPDRPRFTQQRRPSPSGAPSPRRLDIASVARASARPSPRTNSPEAPRSDTGVPGARPSRFSRPGAPSGGRPTPGRPGGRVWHGSPMG